MRYLAAVSEGRENNLNLLRALAATAVLVSHAVPIALGSGVAEPFSQSVGYSLGSLAVFVFFAISGFLITGSFERSSSLASFLAARVLRLMPGLIVNIAFVAFILGPLVTTLSVSAYFANVDVYAFFVRNVTLVFLQFELPGVFQDLPYPPIVGSIWTLIYEVLCYAGVFLVGVLGLLRHRALITAVLLAYLGVSLVLAFGEIELHHRLDKLMRLSMPFAVGMAFYVWRDRIPLSMWGIAGTIALAWLSFGTPIYFPALTLAIAYTTFWLAYIPGGALRAYNRIGDYSYGIYVYAFPLQGFAVWLFGPQTPWENVLYALPMTLVFSVASWHLVEAPALQHKNTILRMLGYPGKADAPAQG